MEKPVVTLEKLPVAVPVLPATAPDPGKEGKDTGRRTQVVVTQIHTSDLI